MAPAPAFILVMIVAVPVASTQLQPLATDGGHRGLLVPALPIFNMPGPDPRVDRGEGGVVVGLGGGEPALARVRRARRERGPVFNTIHVQQQIIAAYARRRWDAAVRRGVAEDLVNAASSPL